jgi:hypothetical protein
MFTHRVPRKSANFRAYFCIWNRDSPTDWCKLCETVWEILNFIVSGSPVRICSTAVWKPKPDEADIFIRFTYGKSMNTLFLCSWVRASWINVNNCPTKCDFVQFLFTTNCSSRFGRYLHPSSGARVNCNYSIWHWTNCMLSSSVPEESKWISDSPAIAEDSIQFDQCQML